MKFLIALAILACAGCSTHAVSPAFNRKGQRIPTTWVTKRPISSESRDAIAKAMAEIDAATR